MKKLLILSTVLGATLLTTSAYSQVYIKAHVGFGFPHARVVVATPPVVYQSAPVYQQPVYQEPVYQDPGYQDPAYQQPVYQNGCATGTVVYENEFPGYAYYTYPAWNGHYRDRIYYTHYRPYFERDNRGYFRGGRFDHARFEHERHAHRGRW